MESALRAMIWCASAAFAVAAAILGAGGAAAAPLTAIQQAAARQDSAVVKVHRRSYRHRHYSGRYYHRRTRVVEAPFTYVESGRRVLVEAPFATVYVGRHGRYIRAPFVNLWIPR